MDEIPKEKHDHGPLKFPENFLWGTATAAHQVEGGNVNSDWWQWEKNKPEDRRSGKAADQYVRYEEDFKIARSLNLNAQRISIEWARIEPEPGVYDQTAIDHYHRVLKSLKEKNFKVMLTLWHFTLPNWVAEIGGWENPLTVEYYLRFLEKIVPLFDHYVDFWVTLNEPGVYVYMCI
jgi:beta-glucosidase